MSGEVLDTPSNPNVDTPHAEPPTNDEQSQRMCETRAQQVIETTSAPASNDPAVTEKGPRPLAELCQDQVKEGEEVQASQLHDDLCSTLLNGSFSDPTLSDTTIHPGGSDSAKESQPEGSAGKPPETDESSSRWVDVLGNGQLMKKTICAGEGPSSRPTPECSVKMKVKGYLESGKAVEYSHPYKFIVGDGDVIQAWDLAASLMERREVALVKAHPRLAYGESGKQPDVPPNATVTFELQLLEVYDPIDYSMATEDDTLAHVNAKCSRGNDLFQKKDYERALNSYCKGRTMMERYLSEQHLEASKAIKDMQIRCWNNLAAAAVKVGEDQEALKAVQNVLKWDPNNIKALFRCGKITASMGDYATAVESLQKAADLSPDEKFIQTELQSVIKKRSKSIEDEKALYRRMIGTAKPEKPQSPSHKVTTPVSDPWGPIPYLAVAASVAAVGIGIAYYFFQRH